MAEREQVKPLAPASDHQSSDGGDGKGTATHLKNMGRRRRKYTKCCACVITAPLVILVTVIIILIFTVFKVKDPEINLNGVQVTQLDLINGTTPRPGTNMSLTADISLKNPNFASFKYKNPSTSLYYRGSVVGEARVPPGQSKARRTVRMNVTMDIIVSNLLSIPELPNDVSSGLITLSSYTRVGGRVKMLSFVKRHVTVRMNCTMTVNITSRSIQEQKCKKKVKL